MMLTAYASQFMALLSSNLAPRQPSAGIATKQMKNMMTGRKSTAP